MALQNITLPPVRAKKSHPYEVTTASTVHVEIEDGTTFVSIKNAPDADGRVYIRFDRVDDTDVVYHASNPNNWDAVVYPWENVQRFLVWGFIEEQKITHIHLLAVWATVTVDITQA